MKIGTKAYFRRLLLAAASPTLKLNRQYRRGVDLLAENAALSFRVGRQDRQTGKPLAEWPFISETAPEMLIGSMALCEQAYRLGYRALE